MVSRGAAGLAVLTLMLTTDADDLLNVALAGPKFTYRRGALTPKLIRAAISSASGSSPVAHLAASALEWRDDGQGGHDLEGRAGRDGGAGQHLSAARQ